MDDAFHEDVRAMLDRHGADLVELQRRYPNDTGNIVRCEFAFALGLLSPEVDAAAFVQSVLDQLGREKTAQVRK